MKKLHNKLSGENLARYLNIQENIRITQRRISLGGAPDIYERVFHEDILPFAGTTKHVDGSLTLSLSSVSEELPVDSSEERRALEVHRKAEFGFGYRDVRDERSDWMLDELKFTTKEAKNKLSRATESSQCKIVRTGTISSAEENKLEHREPENQNRREIDMRLYDNISPEEEKKIYEHVCNRYGKESGRRYLLVRSVSAPEKKIEEWTTCERKSPKSHIYRKQVTKCQERSDQMHKGKIICPEISEDVTKKMQTLVEILPFCYTERIQERKRWKDVLVRKADKKSHQKMMHVSIKGESDSSIFSSEEKSDYTPCSCGFSNCDCDLNRVKCEVPKIKKKCDMGVYEVDEINNYLITCREHLQDKQHQDRRVTVLQQHAENVANRNTRESVYLQAAHDQAENELIACLMKVMPPQGQEVSDEGFNHVQDLANVIAEHKMINEHEWRVWRYSHAKMEHVENSDELDSLDSDIVESTTSDDDLSECNIKTSKGLQPSRIPYFKETFELANTFFEKISAKLDKIVSKNHDKQKMPMKTPKTRLLKEKFKLLRDDNRLFNQICKKLNFSNYYSKSHIPFSERKRRKRARSSAMKVELNRKQKRRQLIEGLQLGKRYRRPKRSFLFTEKENYRGFSPRKQKFLQLPGKDKFRKCNLVGSDLSGRRLTKKVIHNDYRLIRRLFDDQLQRNKESLWDPGMKARMEEYLGAFKQEQTSPSEKYEDETEEDATDVSFDIDQRRPKKDEQKTQTAQPYSWSYCSRSSGNAAETFASMIRSLRSDAKSQAICGRESRDDPSKFSGIRGTASSFWTSTAQSSSLETVRKRLETKHQSLDSRPSRPGGPRPSSKPANPLKSHQYTPAHFPPFGMSDTDSSVPRMSNLKKVAPPGKQYAKSTKTLPPKTKVMNLSQKYPAWKSSKTVR